MSIDSDPIPSRIDSDPFAGAIGNFSANLADRMGGASAHIADNTVFRHASGFLLDLYDSESGKPKLDRDGTLEQMRASLGFVETKPGEPTPKSIFDDSIGFLAEEVSDTTDGPESKRLVWEFMSEFANKLYDEKSGEPLYSLPEAINFVRTAVDNAPHT